MCRETIYVVSPMGSSQNEFPPSIRVECPNCGFFGPVTLTFAEGGTADYEGLCGSELPSGDVCGASLLVTVTLPDVVDQG